MCLITPEFHLHWGRRVWAVVFVSYGCSNKLSDLKQHKFSSTVLEARNWKSVSLGYSLGVSRAVLPLETLGQTPSLCLFQLLELPSLHTSVLYSFLFKASITAFFSHVTFSSVPDLPLPLSLTVIFVITFRVHPDNPGYSTHLEILNLIIHAKSFLPCKVIL